METWVGEGCAEILVPVADPLEYGVFPSVDSPFDFVLPVNPFTFDVEC